MAVWHGRGRGFWVFYSALFTFGPTWLLQKYVLTSRLPGWIVAVDLIIAALICIGIGLTARMQRSSVKMRDSDTGRLVPLPPPHTLQGLSITTWGIGYVLVAVLWLWLRPPL